MPRPLLLTLLLAGLLAGCSADAGDEAGIGRVEVGAESAAMLDQVAWREDDGAVVLVFSSRPLDHQRRSAMTSGHHVVPEDGERMMRLRFEAKPGAGGAMDVGSAALTLWNFSAFPIVLETASGDPTLAEMFPSLRGDLKPSGWVAGITRGTRIQKLYGEKVAMLWNVEFQANLSR